jgi:hypothetical protein
MANPQRGRSTRTRESAGAPGEGLLRRFEEAHANYSRAVEEASSAQERQKRLEEAYLGYLRGVFEASPKRDPVGYLEAYVNYGRAVREAVLPSEIRDRLVEAFRTYLRAHKEAWADVDVDALDAAALAALAQGMLAVASSASWTLALGSEGSAV